MTAVGAIPTLPTTILFTLLLTILNYTIMTLALLFAVDVHRYSRYELDRMSENELYGLAMNADYETMVLTLDELSEAFNNEEIVADNWWLYFINK